jgi:phospholipid/cholesterol/gamma-HCH transport system permease protein
MTAIFKILAQIGHPFYGALSGIGEFIIFTRQVFYWSFRKPFRVKRFFMELEKIGVRSTVIIVLVALFAGMVFALQTGSAFRLFNAETLVGSTVGIALTRELAPVFTALMIVARACSAMAAEIGTMKVTEQVDALKSMAVNPLQFLVVPKVWATTLMVPLLTGLFNGVGLFGSYLVAVKLLDIPEGPYLEQFRYIVDPGDLYQGLIKAVIFGFLISLIACYKGYQTENGAEGVGRSTTEAVVLASVVVLVSDYFLATWLLQIFPETY